MPLTLNPVFHFYAIAQGSECEAVVARYHAGKAVCANDLVKLKLRDPAIMVIIQKGDKWRATTSFATSFAMNSDNGTYYYLRVPANFDGEHTAPAQAALIVSQEHIAQLSHHIQTPPARLASFGNPRTIDVPLQFRPAQHYYTATAYWLSKNIPQPQ